MEELMAGLAEIGRSPADGGRLEMIVRRPAVGERETIDEGRLDVDEGLVGDSWRQREGFRLIRGQRHRNMQLNLMNARAIGLIAHDRAQWPLAGDQLFVDLDLAPTNLPPWSRIALGDAVIEVTDEPHTGCAKFVKRFGVDAMKFVNSTVGRAMNLRGINARVVTGGAIRVGDIARKL